MNQLLQSYTPEFGNTDDFWGRVGISARGPRLHEALHQGMPYGVFQRMAREADLERKELAETLAIPPATLRRRAKAGCFKTEESDRLYRFATVLQAAYSLFEGDHERARQWLRHPVRGLG